MQYINQLPFVQYFCLYLLESLSIIILATNSIAHIFKYFDFNFVETIVWKECIQHLGIEFWPFYKIFLKQKILLQMLILNLNKMLCKIFILLLLSFFSTFLNSLFILNLLIWFINFTFFFFFISLFDPNLQLSILL